MTIYHTNGAFDHIQHMWQPHENWTNGLAHLMAVFHDFECVIAGKSNYSTLYVEPFVWTVKIDDAMSARVGKIGGRYGVTYKTGSRDLLFTEEEILAEYAERPWIREHLRRLFRIAPSLFKNWEDDISYQVGMLYPSSHDLDAQLPVPEKITPNVTSYIFPHVKPNAMIALAPILKVFHRPDGSMGTMTQDIDFAWFSRLSDVVTIDPRPKFDHKPDRKLFDAFVEKQAELGTAKASILQELERFYPEINIYLNAWIKNDWGKFLPDNMADDFWSFVHERREVSRAQLKTEAGREKRLMADIIDLDELEEKRGSLEHLFEVVHTLTEIRDLVLQLAKGYTMDDIEQHPVAEGLVVTRSAGGGMLAWKFVPEDFSRKNFEVYDEIA